jgi:curved DNA-binding protein CbpA
MHDPYEVLQVHRQAEPEVIRAAYRALARKHHPDFGGEPSRMIAITEAYATLGNAERRSAYDTQSLGSQNRRITDPKSSLPVRPSPLPGPGQSRSGSGTVIDFGRYAGWTVGSLVNHDPEYLEWLARTPIGRRLTVEIGAALAQRASQAAALRPSHQPLQQRRAFFRPWATAGSSR